MIVIGLQQKQLQQPATTTAIDSVETGSRKNLRMTMGQF